MKMAFNEKTLEQQFVAQLRHHLDGWRKKVAADFSKRSFDAELAALQH